LGRRTTCGRDGRRRARVLPSLLPPGERVTAIAGDSTGRALELAAAYFGEIPAGDPPDAVPPAPSHARPSRRLVEERSNFRACTWLAEPGGVRHGDAELDLLADPCSPRARLHTCIVPSCYERRIATDVSATRAHGNSAAPSRIVATAVPGVGLGVIEDAIHGRSRACARPRCQRMNSRATRALTETAFVTRLQSVGGSAASRTSSTTTTSSSAIRGYFSRDIERYRGAGLARVRAAAEAYLGPAHWSPSAPWAGGPAGPGGAPTPEPAVVT